MKPSAASEFDPIRPYLDHEVQPALQRLAQKPSLQSLMRALLPDLPPETMAQQLAEIHDTDTLQARVISKMVRSMLRQSSNGVSISGLESLRPDESYLFISNHRDIILDPAILQVLLYEAGLPTTRIAIGDNLMVSNLVTDLMKLNKSFIVHREVEKKDFYDYSLRLSRYIHHSLKEDRASVWIAQRNGRTKDGNDHTHTALLKMILMADPRPVPEATDALHIRPMAISYEWEPCDGLKVEERYHALAGLAYEKSDKQAMIAGILHPKGRIHLAIGQDLGPEIHHACSVSLNRNQQIKCLCDLIDRFIHTHYRLWPCNYIAYDRLRKEAGFTMRYTPAEISTFDLHLETVLKPLKGDHTALQRLLLEMYARPVENYLKAAKAK